MVIFVVQWIQARISIFLRNLFVYYEILLGKKNHQQFLSKIIFEFRFNVKKKEIELSHKKKKNYVKALK